MKLIELPDINVLIALTDATHARHADAARWFDTAGQAGWATCPATENGFIRITSNPVYTVLGYTAEQARAALEAIISCHVSTHQFWPDDVSLRDETLFKLSEVAGHNQVADVYLLGLCQSRGATFVTLDGKMSTAAIVNPHPDLLRVL